MTTSNFSSVTSSAPSATAAALGEYRVIGVMSRVLLIRHPQIAHDLVVKCVRKSHGIQSHSENMLIPQAGQVPYHAKLHSSLETEDSWYLILQHVSTPVPGCSRLVDWVRRFCRIGESISDDCVVNNHRVPSDSSVYQGRLLISQDPKVPQLPLRRSASSGEHFLVHQQHRVEGCEDAGQVSSTTLPEDKMRRWSAELVAAVGHLHRLGVHVGPLQEDDLMLGPGGHVVLTYRCHQSFVSRTTSDRTTNWCPGRWEAPELMWCRVVMEDWREVVRRADWFSVGVVLYPLFSGGHSWSWAQPRGITAHTPASVLLPGIWTLDLPPEARHLILALLAYHPHERLGASSMDEEEVRSHPFLESLDWAAVVREGCT